MPANAYSFSVTKGFGELGAAVGGRFGIPGAVIGYLIASRLGAGPSVTVVPSTRQIYAGPTAVVAPGFGGGMGVSVTRYRFTNAQHADNVLSGWGGTLTLQPLPFLGSTVLKSPGNEPVVGFTAGTRVPVAVGGGYSWQLWAGKC